MIQWLSIPAGRKPLLQLPVEISVKFRQHNAFSQFVPVALANNINQRNRVGDAISPHVGLGVLSHYSPYRDNPASRIA
jgi:hypothetical protein